MQNGRLIRVRKYRGDGSRTAYIVALADPEQAIELIRDQGATSGDELEDLGRVSGALLASLQPGAGQVIAL